MHEQTQKHVHTYTHTLAYIHTRGVCSQHQFTHTHTHTHTHTLSPSSLPIQVSQGGERKEKDETIKDVPYDLVVPFT